MSDSFVTPWSVARQFLCLWDFPGENIEVGCHALLQRIFSPEIEPASLAFRSLAGGFFTTSVTWEAHQLKLDSSKTIHLPVHWSQLSLLLIESIHVPLLIHLHLLSLLWAPGGRTSVFVF